MGFDVFQHDLEMLANGNKGDKALLARMIIDLQDEVSVIKAYIKDRESDE